MDLKIPLFPDQASVMAERVDWLYFYILAVTVAGGLGVYAVLAYFCAAYAKRREGVPTPRILGSHRLELFWTITPLLIFLTFFAWGVDVYSGALHPPADAPEIFVAGKRWMWKIQYPNGVREINEMHLANHQPVKVTFISEDVIHDFGIPAFRQKIDVLPNRYVTTWYHPTKAGHYHLFCDQYCGAYHSQMVGTIHVLDQADYDEWLRGKSVGTQGAVDGSLAWKGSQQFKRLQCTGCHSGDSKARAPVLGGVYGTRVPLQGGGSVVVDDNYIRESILKPRAKVHEGWSPIMPTFQGQVSEQEVIELIAYIKSLRPGEAPIRADEFPAPVGGAADDAGRKGAEAAMSTLVTAEPLTHPEPPARPEPENYLNYNYGWLSWLLTVDHKRIGMLYLVTITLAFIGGGVAASLIRLNLLSPTGAIIDPELYNRMFTAHGVLMIFFFLIPSIPGVLGNFFIPLMVGARDMAFPKLNLASWYVYVAGFAFGGWALLSGGVDTGWTMYTPYTSKFTYSNVVPVVVGAFIAGFSSIMTGLNIIVTVHRMRAPGMTWFRLPLFVWALYATSIIQLLATPVLAVTLLLLGVEKFCGVGIFDPALDGDPVLFQHMFWFYSHPAVYIMILPGMGVISEVITCFSRKNIFGYNFVAFSSVGIAVVGFIVWGHHMFVAGEGVYLAMVFSLLSMLVAVPSAIKVFNWTATLYKGQITFAPPMLFAIGFIVLFTIGGLTGLFLGTLGTDIHLHDTYFVIAHFHFVMVGGMVVAYFAGLHFWWPKMTGRMYSEWWSKLAATIIAVGFFLTFMPQFILGYLGMPRRYHSYPPEFQVLNVMSTAGASILGVGYVLPFFYLFYSFFWGPKAGPNPWHATGLEWQTSSPPPVHNFHHTPIVTHGPYEYTLEIPQGTQNGGAEEGNHHVG